jgi:mono/diheme cytochrome c family protein
MAGKRYRRCLGFTVGVILAFVVAFASTSSRSFGSPEDAEKEAADDKAAKIDYAKQIQPLLKAKCYECHAEKKQEGGLRLDVRSAALRGGELGAAIVPEKAAESLLIKAVSGESDDITRMPAEGDALSPEEIKLLGDWIDQGAEWPETGEQTGKDARDHWAFKAPVRPALPEVKQGDWVRNDIDRFVLARLEKEGLSPSVEADKATLLRRLSLDLIGLPPTIAELDAFLADTSTDAYEKQVERLLKSPHYGERWGRHWLDAARYADSDGFEKDKSRFIWFYRDWVINAFNKDMPYDQFVIEQIAGDQLPNATQDQIVATGFLRNSMINEEGGIDPEQFRMEAMFDRMDCIGKSVLGLTIQCAQCHTHKFDPITQEEYYRVFAFLNNDHESQPVVYTSDELLRRDDLSRQIKEIEAGLKVRAEDWRARMAKWEAEVATKQVAWETLEPAEYAEVGGGAKLKLLGDQSMLCGGYAPTKCTYRVSGPTKLKRVTAVRIELLNDPNLPCNGPGRSFKGTCALTELRVEAAANDKFGERQSVKIAKSFADFEQAESPLEPNFDDRSGKKRIVGPVKFAVDGKDETAWAIDAGPGRRNQPREAVFVFEKPVEFEAGVAITVHLAQNHGGWNSDDHQNNLLGRFRVSVTAADVNEDPTLTPRVREVLTTTAEKRSAEQVDALFRAFRASVAEWKAENEKIAALWSQWPAGQTTFSFTARENPRETHVLRRGDFLKPAKEVSAGVPAVLHPLPEDANASRLAFARWLVDRKSPTTARVFVNRIWQNYFGTGIVATSEDFGVQSEAPSHPGLLDWLAVEFMDRGWKIKDMHRMIVTSATYRQSSRVTTELLERDPANRLLARGSRLRVDGEIVRDIALATSGLLNPKLGGPSVFAPAPEFLFQPPNSYAPFPWETVKGPERYRRAVYTFRRRSTPYPALSVFDVPNADFSCVRRARSNTPMQALTTLNEEIFVDCARALAVRVLREGGKTDDARIKHAFRLVVSREPAAEETEVIRNLLIKQRRRIAGGWVNPWEVATGAGAKPEDLPNGATPADLAAYTVAARVVLNLDEAITRE